MAALLDTQKFLGTAKGQRRSGLGTIRFPLYCKVVGFRTSTTKTEAVVLDWKKVVFLLWVDGKLLLQVEDFQYLGVLFTT